MIFSDPQHRAYWTVLLYPIPHGGRGFLLPVRTPLKLWRNCYRARGADDRNNARLQVGKEKPFLGFGILKKIGIFISGIWDFKNRNLGFPQILDLGLSKNMYEIEVDGSLNFEAWDFGISFSILGTLGI